MTKAIECLNVIKDFVIYFIPKQTYLISTGSFKCNFRIFYKNDYRKSYM